MRYHYELPEVYTLICGQTYICNHPVYSRCTLYTIKKLGLAVIQQRIDDETKATTWTEIDPWLVDEIYTHSGFRRYFEQKAGDGPPDHVGAEDETAEEGALGNRVRPEHRVMFG